MESRWIWPFELLEKLGEGGMGVVYRARYVGNDRQVAVKLLPDGITADSMILARFERELEVLKNLKHRNIVHCFGGRCESKQRFYAMELVTGGTLADYLFSKGRFSWDVAIEFAIQMCSALQCAHDHGVIHRDVKPGNFLMTESKQLKLSDFGLASVVSGARLTAAGRTVGTILYMAPEQVRGGTINHQADLYALGCVIFEMLTGATPYSGDNAAEVLQKHLKDPPPHVLRSVPDCPLELDELICDLLNKSPSKRPATAAEVLNRLEGILLPSRNRKQIEPMLFAIQTSVPVEKTDSSDLKESGDQWQSGTVLSTKKQKPRFPERVYWTAFVVMLVICLRLWFGWSQAAAQLRQSEQIWMGLLDAPEPRTQILAAQSLGKFDSLSSVAINRLSHSAKSQNLELRLAALKSLTRHASEARALIAELIRIQKIDDSMEARNEAALAVEAIRRTGVSIPFYVYLFWTAILAGVVGGAIYAQLAWKTMAKYSS